MIGPFDPGPRVTLARAVSVRGVGLHSGAPVRLSLRPAASGHGVTFRRTDRAGAPTPAIWSEVTDTRLCTVLGRGEGSVATVEHLMAALAGRGIDDVAVELDGPETPALDGSSGPYGFLLDAAGRRAQTDARTILEVIKPVEIRDGDRWVRLEPCDGFEIDLEIDFDDPAVGVMRRSFRLAPGRFDGELSRARTFGFRRDLEAMRSMGLAQGGSLANAVVVDDGRIANDEGLRRPDEFVRHKLLDCLGDLRLAGAPLRAKVTAVKPGHRLHVAALDALLRDETAFRRVTPESDRAAA